MTKGISLFLVLVFSLYSVGHLDVKPAKGLKKTVQLDRQMLSPLLRFGMTVSWMLDPSKKNELKDLSDKLGTVEGGATLEDNSEVLFDKAVEKCTELWIEEIKKRLRKELGENDASEEWNKFVDDDIYWGYLLSVYLGTYRKEGVKVYPAVKKRIEKKFAEFRIRWIRSPGKGQVRSGTQKMLTDEEHENLNKAIRATVEEGGVVKRIPIANSKMTLLGTFVILDDEIYAKNIEKYNAPYGVLCHPGTNSTKRNYNLADHLGTYGKVEKNFYIKESFFNKLTTKEMSIVAKHELAHILIPLGKLKMPEDVDEEEWINNEAACDIRPILDRLGLLNEIELQILPGDPSTEPLAAEDEEGTPLVTDDFPLVDEETEITITLEDEDGDDETKVDYEYVDVAVPAIPVLPERPEEEDDEAFKLPAITTEAYVTVAKNIEHAEALNTSNRSVSVVAVVSDEESKRKEAEDRLKRLSGQIFNSDGSTRIISLLETLGEKQAQGNFLGTLLAYRRIKEELGDNNPEFRDVVTLMGMLSGRGDKISPFAQIEGGSKSEIIVSAGVGEEPLSAAEESLKFSVPIAKYMEDRGFKGVLAIWGDQTLVPSEDLTGVPEDAAMFSRHDVIKVVSVLKITDELAEHKDWVVFDADGDIISELPRNKKDVLIEQLKILGVKPIDGEYYAGVSLGPVAVSYSLLDIAEEVFKDEIEKDGVTCHFDPYFMMALAMTASGKAGRETWEAILEVDENMQKLAGPDGLIPAFYDKVDIIRKTFENQDLYNRDINMKVLDMGGNIYWADIGQHWAMRKKFMNLNLDEELDGSVARSIQNIHEDRDENGNILIGDCHIDPGVEIKNSIIINSHITGKSRIEDSVVENSSLKDVTMTEAFSVLSHRMGRTVLKRNSGLYKSLGNCFNDLELEEGMRHGTLLTADGPVGMLAHESDKEDVYDRLVYGNPMSFKDAHELMSGVSGEELERRRAEELNTIRQLDILASKHKPLRCGVAGYKDSVDKMTDMEVYITIRGFIEHLIDIENIERGEYISLAGDLRPSTDRMMMAAAKAIIDSGCKVDGCGLLPSAALSYWGVVKKRACVMVTGGHTKKDMNGFEFYQKPGVEVQEGNWEHILESVTRQREKIYLEALKDQQAFLFKEDGYFKKGRRFLLDDSHNAARSAYMKRYFDAFPADLLKGKKIAFYQHFAVGRDIIHIILESLGAEVIEYGRGSGDDYVTVDPERGEKTEEKLREVAREFALDHGEKPFAVISTDGDSSKPLLADEDGNLITGDRIGVLASRFLDLDFVAVPNNTDSMVIKALKLDGADVVETRVGSRNLLKGINDELKRDANKRAGGFEPSGGFVLGSYLTIMGDSQRYLRPLPGRDALLPMLSAMAMAVLKPDADPGPKTLSELNREVFQFNYHRQDIIAKVDDHFRGTEEGKEMSRLLEMAMDILRVDDGSLSIDFKRGLVSRTNDTGEADEISLNALVDKDPEDYTQEDKDLDKWLGDVKARWFGIRDILELVFMAEELPTIETMSFSPDEGNRVLNITFSPSYNDAGVFDDFENLGIRSSEMAVDFMEQAISRFTPMLKDKEGIAVDFENNRLICLKDGTYRTEAKGLDLEDDDMVADIMDCVDVQETLEALLRELLAEDVREQESRQVAVDLDEKEPVVPATVDKIKYLSFLDGLKIVLSNDDVIHLRPSTTAAEFRAYASSDTPEQARKIVKFATGRLIPALIKNVVTPYVEARRTFEEQVMLTNSLNAVAEGKAVLRVLGHLDSATKRKRQDSDVRELTIEAGWFGGGIGKDIGSTVKVVVEGGKIVGEVTMKELVKAAPLHLLGTGVVENFGDRLLMTGIIKSQTAPVVRCCHSSEKVIVVTGADMKKSKIKPRIIVGFDPDSLDWHKEDMKDEYKKAMIRFREALEKSENFLIQKGQGKLLKEKGDLVLVLKLVNTQDKSGQSGVLLNEIYEAWKELESMYNYVEVKEGDVINIPRGMVYAIGRGVECHVSTMPETTMAIDDRSSRYPIMKAVSDDMAWIEEEDGDFLDWRHLDELNYKPWKERKPVVISRKDNVMVESLSGEFEGSGLAVRRITLGKDGDHEESDISSFHTLTVVKGSAQVIVENKVYELQKLDMGKHGFTIPATVGRYRIISGQGAVVLDTYVPLPSSKLAKAPFQRGKPLAGMKEPPFEIAGIAREFGKGYHLSDDITITGRYAKLPKIIDGREHRIVIQRGSIGIVLPAAGKDKNLGEKLGERLMDQEKHKIVRFSEGRVLIVGKNGIRTEDGEEYPFVNTDDGVGYVIEKLSPDPVVLKVDYDQSEEERITYNVNSMIKRHLGKVVKNNVDMVLPAEMFVKGDVKKIGSKEWVEKRLNKSLGKRDLVKIHTYNMGTELYQIKDINIRKGAVAVFGITKSDVQDVNDFDDDMKEFLDQARILALPDLDSRILSDDGWLFNMEIAATALLQSALTIDNITEALKRGKRNIAYDVRRVMEQLTGKDLSLEEMYFMLSFNEVWTNAKEIKVKISGPFEWLRTVVGKLLLDMPIVPFDATEPLVRRRLILWSA